MSDKTPRRIRFEGNPTYLIRAQDLLNGQEKVLIDHSGRFYCLTAHANGPLTIRELGADAELMQ